MSALTAFLLALVRVLAAQAGALQAPHAEQGVDLARWEDGPPRLEHFAIGQEHPDDVPLGLVRHLEGVREGRTWIERDTHWLDARTRVLHVESPIVGAPLLVWREVRRRGGRTLLLVQDRAGGPVRAVEWEGGDATRTEAAVGERPATPLLLLADLRRDARAAGPLALFDPLARETEALTLAIARAPLPALPLSLRGRSLRCVEARRPDGELALRAVFAGRALLAWQVQEDGPVARRISALRHDALLRTHRDRGASGPAGAFELGRDARAVQPSSYREAGSAAAVR